MSKKKGLLAGPKINNRHSTYNSVAAEVIAKLKPYDTVKKIVLGPISPVRASSLRRITVREDKTQAKILCRDKNSVQILWVIGADVDVLKEILSGIPKNK